jgi:hypothetical protein
LVIGALAGLAWFLIILLMPSDIPDDVDGGAGLHVLVFFIAAVFAIVGGVLGGLVGLLLAGTWHVARCTMSPRSTKSGNLPKPGKQNQPFDDLLG